MDIKLTNAEILNLYGVLSQAQINGNPKFTYTLSKNRATLKPYAEALQEANQEFTNSPRYKEYLKKGDELIKQFAVDDKGKPVTRQSADGQVLSRVIPQPKQADYMLARTALDDEYRDILLAADAHNADFARLLKEEVEVKDLRTVPLKDVPDVNSQIMNLIFIFVEDTTPGDKAEK